MSALTMARMAGVRRDARVMSKGSWFVASCQRAAGLSKCPIHHQKICGASSVSFGVRSLHASALAVR